MTNTQGRIQLDPLSGLVRRCFRAESGRVGPGRVGSGRVTPTRPYLREVSRPVIIHANILLRPDLYMDIAVAIFVSVKLFPPFLSLDDARVFFCRRTTRVTVQSSAEVYKGMMKIHKGGEQQHVAIKRMVPEALQGLQNFQREARLCGVDW